MDACGGVASFSWGIWVELGSAILGERLCGLVLDFLKNLELDDERDRERKLFAYLSMVIGEV